MKKVACPLYELTNNPFGLKLGASANFGWINGGSNAQDTNDFLKGYGGSVSVSVPTPVPLSIGVNKSYGGKTALELGGTTSPGVSVTPLSYGWK